MDTKIEGLRDAVETLGPFPRPSRHVCFFGNFGTQNFGNECTLQAVIHNLRSHLPDARLTCICEDPEDTSKRHNIPAIRMSHRPRHELHSRVSKNRALRLLRRIFIRIPAELIEWIRAFKTLQGTNMLIMPGTGMVGDFGIRPFGLHYQLLKWSLMAKLAGCKVLFASVGANPIEHPLSRWLVKSALSLADYRSYRDLSSKRYLESLGVNTRDGFVYPDLVFSLPKAALPGPRTRPRQDREIGVGLMDYYGKGCSREQGERIYRDYRDKMAAFVAWLLEHSYTVRLLIGDLRYDKRVREDITTILKAHGSISDEAQLISEPISDVDQLLSQLAATDVVVATRFHNVLLALMLGKPVASISYDQKNDSLMAEMGLADYCQHIEHLDTHRLLAQFLDLEKNATALTPGIKRKAEEYRDALDEQYRLISRKFRPELSQGAPA
jgi:polysaccharide pyruvyl transferase WcaK-like protein